VTELEWQSSEALDEVDVMEIAGIAPEGIPGLTEHLASVRPDWPPSPPGAGPDNEQT